MTKIILVRHGHVEGIDPPRFRGRTEILLTDLGVRQAAATAGRISKSWALAAIYTSPMRRCVATAKAISVATGVAHETLGTLNDLDYGSWQGRTHQEVEAQDPELFARWREAPHLVRFPAGDSLQDLVGRGADAIRLVLDRHKIQTVVMVGHDSVNRAILLQLLDQPLSAYWRLTQDPCGISEIDVLDGRVCARLVNGTRHLAED
jgi:phosphoserine phosphatase